MNEPIKCEITINGETYLVEVSFRYGMRNINYRLNNDTKTFLIHAPLYTSKKKIFFHLNKFAPKLIKRASKINKPAISNNEIYLFGKNIPLILGDKNVYSETLVTYRNKDDLNKLLKKLLSSYLDSKLPYYESLMNIKPYKYTVRNMRSRHGSNSRRSHHLSFATSLVHYSPAIIDSVIIHELAHDVHFDHSKRFYDLVYTYCPDYKLLKKALNNRIYNYGIN